MTDRIRRANTETYERTASGLLTMRSNLIAEAATIRDRLAEIKNNLDAVDHVLRAMGHTDLDAKMPAPHMKRDRLFGHGELTRLILDVLRTATEPLAAREIGRRTLTAIGQDPADNRLLSDHTTRVCKALRPLRADGVIQRVGDLPGKMRWTISANINV